MKSRYLKITIFVLMIGLLSACGSQSANTPTSPSQATQPAAQSQNAQAGTVSFAHDILPILQSRCVNCHGQERVEKNLNLKTYTDMMQGSENGPVITPGNAADSKLVEMIVNQKMPKRGPKLTPPQVQLFTEWVNQGAPNN
jgi:uncharacterized membrane protein